MTNERIQEIYSGLDDMVVPLDQTPELGLEYFRDKMHECRRKQDWVADRIVEVNREFSRLRMAIRAGQRAVEIARDSAQHMDIRRQLREHEGSAEALKYLTEALKIKIANLKQTGSDIRLIVKVVEQGLESGGEVQPPAEGSALPEAARKPRAASKPRPNRAVTVVDAPPPAAIREVVPLTVASEVAPLTVEPPVTPPAVPVEAEESTFDIEAFLNA